jgi:hypothetical protein
MKNRLQFRYHDQVFDTREAAIEYVQSQIRFSEEGLAKDNPSYGYSLLAEPTVLLYKNVTEEDPEGENNPHLIFVIGSKTNEEGVETGHGQYSDNRFCIIDIDKTEQEIADLAEELEKAIKSLTLIALSSDTLNFYADKTEDGTYVSGDVKVADSYIYEDVRYNNNMMVTPDGLFIYVNLEYDPTNEKFKFTVSNNDGTFSETVVDIYDNFLVSGYYAKEDEKIHLQMKNGDEVVVDCEDLIAEWGVEGSNSRTPIMLFKEEVDYDHTDEHHHVEPWQDVLRADIRIKDETYDIDTKKYSKDPRSTNILERTQDGRYLFVDGKASNIIYYMDGEKSNVKAALDKLSKIKISTDTANIIQDRTDGFFASTTLEYVSNENMLVFKASGQPTKNIKLNSVEFFKNVYYDPVKEELVITYIDSEGKTQIVRIPIGEMIKDWEWEVQNEGHNVKLVKTRNKSGNDKLSADVKLFEGHNNILVDTNHSLYVRGEADNIKYGENSNVKNEIDNLKATDATLDNKINIEIARAEAAEQALDEKIDQEIADRTAEVERIDTTIGDGFSTDAHETVTYKFNQLQDQVNSEAEKLNNEIDRSTAKDDEHDERLDAIDAEIGEGFNPRNTVRDEIDNLQSEIDAVSANTSIRLTDVINEDESIDVETRNDAAGKPTVKVVKVNLSTEVEDERKNIIKLNSDGLFANVDLSYIEEANKLIFHTSNGEPDKEIQLESMSSIIDIRYDAAKEAIIITYMTNGHEIKTVEIPVGDLINEWRVEDGHPHAVQLEKVRIASGTTEQDVLKASVIISDTHDDNILIMDDGALYVSGQGITDNKAEIDALKERMTTAEDDIDALEDGLREETSARTLADNALEDKIDDEITRSTAEDERLSLALQQEIADREQGDAELAEEIRANKLIFDDTASIDFNNPYLENNVVTANVKLQQGENIIKLGSGLYATVSLSYDPARNTIKLVTSNGEQEAIQLNTVGSLIDSIEYDATNRALVVKYHDAAGNQRQMSFPVNQLFNDWIVENPSEKSAIEMTKTSPAEPDDPDKLSARILITDDLNGDGKPDDGSDNLVEIRNNGLYVCGSAMTEAQDVAKCVKNEVKVFEKVVLGHMIGDECGSGYTYEPNLQAVYINSATSFNNADYILDLTINKVSGDVADAKEGIECIDSKADKMYELLYGEGETLANCGEGKVYIPDTTSCVISGATSFMEADRMMAYQICEILEMWVSGETCTTKSDWVDDGANKKMLVDVKLSRGNDGTMTDDEIVIENLNGDYIDPTNKEFTDTNALRIVCLTDGGSVTHAINTPQNGIYLSNVWDCGLYYGPADTEAKAAAAAAGYKTDYETDESEGASAYNYMNNVRRGSDTLC